MEEEELVINATDRRDIQTLGRNSGTPELKTLVCLPWQRLHERWPPMTNTWCKDHNYVVVVICGVHPSTINSSSENI